MNRTLYFGGSILTMTDSPAPEAVLTEDGVICQVGTFDALSAAAPDARRFDLRGHALLPSFIDAHSHLTSYANTLGLATLDGVKDFDESRTRLTRYRADNPPAPGGWVTGFGYDNNLLPEGRHPDRSLLDSVSGHIPILIAHASGHMGAANTAALRSLGVTADTPDPEGGRIGREADGKTPNGYLEETAFTVLAARALKPSADALCRQIIRAQEEYLKYGITTVQDGLTRSGEWPLLQALSQRGDLLLDTVCYIDMNLSKNLLADNASYLKKYKNRLKIGGYKIFLDGSPQGRTAWMREPYEGDAGGYRGYPIYPAERVTAFMQDAVAEQVQILVHCNGDAAAEQMLDAYEAAADAHGSIRPVMIHAQLAAEDELLRMARLGVIPSFFVAHTWYWGDAHLKNFGAARAMKISPAHTALQLGLPFTFHQDTPVIAPDMMESVWCAANRVSRAGVVMGEGERISVRDALLAVTRNAAYQYFEEDRKGTIAAGKLANFVVLERDPLACPPEQVRDIPILATIREDELLYRR